MNINKKSWKITNDNFLKLCQMYLFCNALIDCVEIYLPVQEDINYLENSYNSGEKMKIKQKHELRSYIRTHMVR